MGPSKTKTKIKSEKPANKDQADHVSQPETAALDCGWYLYMVEDERGRFYSGITTDVARRFQEHCDVHAGVPGAKGAKFFRSSRPLRVVYQEACIDRAEASRRERALKALPKSRKRALIAGVPVEDL